MLKFRLQQTILGNPLQKPWRNTGVCFIALLNCTTSATKSSLLIPAPQLRGSACMFPRDCRLLGVRGWGAGWGTEIHCHFAQDSSLTGGFGHLPGQYVTSALLPAAEGTQCPGVGQPLRLPRRRAVGPGQECWDNSWTALRAKQETCH